MMEYPFKDLLPHEQVLEREGYYNDWTHLDPNTFYSIVQISEMIKTKGFGSDVRLLISQLAEHFGLSVVEVTDIANSLIARQSVVEDRQDAVEVFNNQVVQEMTDKDAISAPEIIQARKGEANLNARLENEANKMSISLGVKVLDFVNLIPLEDKLSPDMADWDWYEAIQGAVNQVQNHSTGGKVLFPNFMLRTSKSIIQNKNTPIQYVGPSFNSGIRYIGDFYDSTKGMNGLAVLIINPAIQTTGSKIDSLTLDGGEKALWSLYANNAYNTYLHVKLRRSAGFLRMNHCYNSNYESILCEFSMTSKPSEISQADWDLVRANGQIHITQGNNDKYGSFKVYGAGFVDQPATALFHISSAVAEFNTLTIERDNVYLEGLESTDKTSFNHLFYIIGSNIRLGTIYAEHINALCIFTSTAPGTYQVQFDNIFINLSNIYYYPFNLASGKYFSLNHVVFRATYLKSNVFVNFGAENKENPFSRHLLYGGTWPVKQVDRAGGTYTDFGSGSNGLASSNGVVTNQSLTVDTGFEVTEGTDVDGYYVAVSPGAFINPKGERVKLGLHFGGSQDSGWLFRPNLVVSAEYEICIDMYGGCYIRRSFNAPEVETGKKVLATLTIGSTLDDKTLSVAEI